MRADALPIRRPLPLPGRRLPKARQRGSRAGFFGTSARRADGDRIVDGLNLDR
jgi:hypothetical protein